MERSTSRTGARPPRGEHDLVVALRSGDERAFTTVMHAYDSALLRVALTFVPSRAVAEEVVQETWLGVLRGIDRFEGRSSLKTWIYRILTNIARSRGERERRSVPFSSLGDRGGSGDGAEPDQVLPEDRDPAALRTTLGSPGHQTPEEGLLSGETREVIARAIGELPRVQRSVISLRDVEGWTSAEVCAALELSEGNQRVLLHRARARVQVALECHPDAVGIAA